MVTHQDLNLILRELREIPTLVKICQDVLTALAETDQPAIRSNYIISFCFPTDYNRARAQLNKRFSGTKRRLKEVRRSTVSPDAIRALSYITQIKLCCNRCERVNRKNVQQGKAIRCQIQEKFEKDSKNGFRFELNQKGQIIERI